MPRAPIHRTIPFALLALLAGCSNADDTSGADASTDAPQTSNGDAGQDGTIPAEAGDDANGPSDADAEEASPPFDAGPFDAAEGHVLAEYPSVDGGVALWERAAPVASAPLVALAATLDAQSAGSDQWANLARDGAYVAFVTTRFGCQSGDCLAVANGDGSSGALVEHAIGTEIVSAGRPAIASGGALLVYPSVTDATGDAGPHAEDLYAIKKTGSAWGAPTLLTAAMVATNAHDVAMSYDGSKVVFDCGPTEYQAPASDICTANTDGSGTSVLIAHGAGPGAGATSVTHHPDFAPDGSIVFEADWAGTEQIWRFTAPSTFALVAASETNDNSPCVLPDGRIASLWLDGPGNTQSLHELKVMSADGSSLVMVVTGIDIIDTGQSCGQ
jgi:hypothetical protein